MLLKSGSLPLGSLPAGSLRPATKRGRPSFNLSVTFRAMLYAVRLISSVLSAAELIQRQLIAA